MFIFKIINRKINNKVSGTKKTLKFMSEFSKNNSLEIKIIDAIEKIS